MQIYGWSYKDGIYSREGTEIQVRRAGPQCLVLVGGRILARRHCHDPKSLKRLLEDVEKFEGFGVREVIEA